MSTSCLQHEHNSLLLNANLNNAGHEGPPFPSCPPRPSSIFHPLPNNPSSSTHNTAPRHLLHRWNQSITPTQCSSIPFLLTTARIRSFPGSDHWAPEHFLRTYLLTLLTVSDLARRAVTPCRHGRRTRSPRQCHHRPGDFYRVQKAGN